jgi:DNA-binding response OmpR family regulator
VPGRGAALYARNMGQRVLVVDDDPTVSDVVRRYLEREGYTVELAGDGQQALDAYATERPDLVVLDLMLPGIDGLEVCRRLREQDLGLEIGADDYVTKPFSPRELVLRVQSVLRRALPAQTSDVFVDGDLRIDAARRTAVLRGRELALTVREFDLLVFLMRNPGRVLRRTELLQQVWGWTFGDQSTVTVHMRRLREKVEDDPAQPRRILTVWGVGYRYEYA